MIVGRVEDLREAVVPLVLIGDDGDGSEIDAVIDTGFTAELALPREIVDELSLEWSGFDMVRLADGTEQETSVFLANVIWHEVRRRIKVHLADLKPLIGMKLLRGSLLSIEVAEGGFVRIESLDAV